MQDGAPCHKARSCMTFLAEHQVSVLLLPGNSPDLNLIENIWVIIKAKKSQATITTRNDLIASVIRLWFRDATLQPIVKRVIDSMPTRIAAVRAAEGGRTKY